MEQSVPLSGRQISLSPFLSQSSHSQQASLECLVPAPFVDGHLSSAQERPRRWALASTRIGQRWQPKTDMEIEVPSMTPSSNKGASLPIDEVFTEEEYNSFLRLDGWDFEETVYLMNLLQQCHYRFIIAADRYSYKAGKGEGRRRDLVDIRERYYTVKEGLSAKRNLPNPPPYSKEADRHHRLKIAAASQVSRELMIEERMLTEMMSRLRICLPKVVKERETLLLNCCNGFSNILRSQDPSFPELAGVRPASRKNAASNAESGKPGKHQKSNSNKATSLKHASSEAVGRKKKSNEEGVTDGEVSSGPGRKPRPALSNTLLASHSLKPIRVGLTRHIDKMMADLGLPPHPDPPTEKVCQKYEELRELLVKLAELQKTAATSLESSQSAGSLPKDNSRRSSRATSPPPIQANVSSPITQQKIAEQSRSHSNASQKRRRE